MEADNRKGRCKRCFQINMGLVWTIINLIVLFLLLRHFLINPVSNIMEQRRKLIADGLQNAQDTQDEANG